ncbi:MAG: LamG domain-containing protein [Myxococcales bacterium]|nr:LamG domain-containing protein [Myxococcales bacterium]
MLRRRHALGWARTGALLAVVVPVLFSGCREPTQITVTLSTDVACPQVSETTLSVGALATISDKPPVSSRKGCKDANGRIGSLVVVPSGDDSDEVTLQAITTVGGQPASACDPKNPADFCVVARRALRFVPHTPLDLPIELSSSCLGKLCADDQTCFQGECRSAKLPDPEACTTPGGCGQPTNDAGQDAPAETSTDAGPEAASDSGTDAGQGDLVAWFDFEGTQSAAVPDLSTYGNHGQLQGAAVKAGVGHTGSGLVVNSTSGTFAVGPTASLGAISQATGVTVALWVKVNAAPPSMGFLFDHDPFGIDDLEAWVATDLGVCIDSVPGHDQLCFLKLLSLGTWLHVTMVADAKMMQAYFNGIPTKAQLKPANFALTKTLYFGYQMDAVLDDVRIYKRVLSASEIAALAK